MTRAQPNLFIPGTQKGASTTLSILLSEHPDVYPGTQKEPHFFSRDSLYHQGLDCFSRTQYPEYSGQRYVLDASVSYLPLHFVPERIYQALGSDVRFIVTLRNPVDRMESAFKHFRELPERETDRTLREIVPANLTNATLDELLEFERWGVRKALTDGRIIGRHETWTRHGFPYRYAYVGCYSTHLDNYFDYFPRENFLFLTFEDLTQNQQAAMHRVAAFLDLPPEPPRPERSLHSSRIKIYKNKAVGRTMRAVKRHVKAYVPTGIKYRLADAERRYLLENDAYTFEPNTYDQLLCIFEQEIDRTNELTGVDLSHWKAGRSETVG